MPVADAFVKEDDGARSWGCEVEFIPHHQPELIIREGRREVERVPLGQVGDPEEFVQAMESRGFERSDEYVEKMENRRFVEFVSGQDADVYFLDEEGSRNHIGAADEGQSITIEASVGDVFVATDGFGDDIKSFRVMRKKQTRNRFYIPAETPDPDLEDEL